ncbi:DUF6266 family protein [Sphingobacterium chuzhouense]|nr:DUF6266 family protein [Sphingobacterium chuzhouense]
MATIRRGANGGFSGKAGSVIGSSWKSIDYIKGLPKKRTKPMTQDQLVQQARFAVLTRFLMPLTPMVRVGYGQIQSHRATAMNVAVQQNMGRAVVGTYPDFSVDYAAVRISEGRLLGGGTVAATVAAGVLTVNWSTDVNDLMDSNADDLVYIVLFQPEIDEFMSTPTLPTREDGEVDITIPDHFLGGKGHVWIFFSDRKAKRVSRSSYLGELDLQ